MFQELSHLHAFFDQDVQDKAVVLAGATATGKSEIALILAEKYGGVVLNADALQAYGDLCLLTARPSLREMERVPHRLYGHLSAREVWSAACFLSEAKRELETIWQNGKIPIVVGGTGLYLTALFEGLTDLPKIPEAIRAYWREQAQKRGAAFLYQALLKKCPHEAERLHPQDTSRLVRALEVFEATGKSLQEHHAQTAKNFVLKKQNTLRFKTSVERTALAQRIANRLTKMVELGALEEVSHLLKLELPPSLPVMKAVGVRALQAFLEGKQSLPEAIEQACTQTRQLAKRQNTWLNKFMADYHTLQCG